MPCFHNRRLETDLHFSGSPACAGTMWVPHGVDQIGVGRNITAETAERLCERAFDNVYAVHHALALGDAPAMGPIHSDRMNLVDVSQRTIPLREIADLMQRRYIAVHGIKAFAQDQLRSVRCYRAKQLLEMPHIVVAPDVPFCA